MWTDQIMRSVGNVDQEEDWWLFYLQLNLFIHIFTWVNGVSFTCRRLQKNEISAKDGDTDREKKEIHNEK